MRLGNFWTLEGLNIVANRELRFCLQSSNFHPIAVSPRAITPPVLKWLVEDRVMYCTDQHLPFSYNHVKK